MTPAVIRRSALGGMIAAPAATAATPKETVSRVHARSTSRMPMLLALIQPETVAANTSSTRSVRFGISLLYRIPQRTQQVAARSIRLADLKYCLAGWPKTSRDLSEIPENQSLLPGVAEPTAGRTRHAQVLGSERCLSCRNCFRETLLPDCPTRAGRLSDAKGRRKNSDKFYRNSAPHQQIPMPADSGYCGCEASLR